ncbi:hypothetical protein K1T71_014102 [Dendrolimus kikuchii]|uniref:Uncharacterized protein n=1 Tax=Dendrolimus kikuchii TaxID=765133 RepID=A0ACC1CF22_9NEOP|nr:hypothetical protein K1T71_014102 [Dendrolimus kikuchii]
MAPPKVAKKPAKTMEKPISKPIVKPKNKKKKNYTSFSVFIYKLLKNLAPDIGISKPSMQIMNNFVNDYLEKIALEASRLVLHGKKNTLSSREISSAIKLLLPGELAKHANIEGTKALKSFFDSKAKESVGTV